MSLGVWGLPREALIGPGLPCGRPPCVVNSRRPWRRRSLYLWRRVATPDQIAGGTAGHHGRALLSALGNRLGTDLGVLGARFGTVAPIGSAVSRRAGLDPDDCRP